MHALWLCAFSLLASYYCQHVRAQQCWQPDGSTMDEGVPCGGGGGDTPGACCGASSFCMDNGLCFGPAVSRESCTDREWGPTCPQYCLSEPDCSPHQACTVIVCDAPSNTFACGVAANCGNTSKQFTMVGGHNINLRPTQVAGLGLGPDALTITSTTNLTSNVTVPQGQNTTVTAVAYVTTGPSAEPSTGPSAETFTAGQMAGVSAGVGVPLLLALLGAVLVITGQRRQLRAIRGTDVHHTVPPRRATGNEHYQDIAQQQQHLYNGHYPGAMPDSSPAKYMQTPDYNAHQPIMRELDNGSQRQEMDAGHPTRELETAQGGNYVGHLKQ